MKQILLLAGSVRQGNFTQYVADFLYRFLQKQADIEVKLIKAADLHLDLSDEGYAVKIPELTAAVKAADGLIIITPEYNHGYPASLKYMLDTATGEYNHKAVAMVGVSKGPYGGVRGVENLLPVLRELGLIVSAAKLNISMVQQEVVDGKFTDPAKWEERAQKMFDEFMWLVNKLS